MRDASPQVAVQVVCGTPKQIELLYCGASSSVIPGKNNIVNWFTFLSFSMTYEMGERAGLNGILEERTKRFTYFVPRDKAWQNSETVYPNALRKLNNIDYNFEVSSS